MNIHLQAAQVAAVLSGEKTQLRLPLSEQRRNGHFSPVRWKAGQFLQERHWVPEGTQMLLPGVPSQRASAVATRALQVREPTVQEGAVRGYLADLPGFVVPEGKKLVPSVLMRRQDVRLLLEVTRFWTEKLGDISQENACAEGVLRDWGEAQTRLPPALLEERRAALSGKGESVVAFSFHWDARFGQRGLGWEANPAVMVIAFVPKLLTKTRTRTPIEWLVELTP